MVEILLQMYYALLATISKLHGPTHLLG